MAENQHLKTVRVANLEKRKVFRDKKTGRYISKKNIENYEKIEKKEGEKTETKKISATPKQPMKEKIIQVMQEQGIDANTVEEVWGHLVGVQAEIAMDKTNGSKATAAAKLVAQVMGTMDDDSPKEEGTETLVLGRQLAKEVLKMIEDVEQEQNLKQDEEMD